MRVGSWLLVAATSVFLLFILRHELADRRAYDRNDSVMHAHALARMDDALDRGEDPLDHWNTTGLGYPFFRTYPPLGHAVALAIHRALPGDRAPEETFQWVRVLLMCLLPLSVYRGARWAGMERWASAWAAALAPLC